MSETTDNKAGNPIDVCLECFSGSQWDIEGRSWYQRLGGTCCECGKEVDAVKRFTISDTTEERMSKGDLKLLATPLAEDFRLDPDMTVTMEDVKNERWMAVKILALTDERDEAVAENVELARRLKERDAASVALLTRAQKAEADVQTIAEQGSRDYISTLLERVETFRAEALKMETAAIEIQEQFEKAEKQFLEARRIYNAMDEHEGDCDLCQGARDPGPDKPAGTCYPFQCHEWGRLDEELMELLLDMSDQGDRK